MDDERRRNAIYFEDGTPSKARTAELVSPLDRTLLDMGLLDEETLASSLRSVARTKRLHGKHLVDKGLIDEEALEAALSQQMVNKIGHMFRLPATTRFAYFAAVDLMADYGGTALTPCDPLALIMMGVRKYVPDAPIEVVIGRLRDTPLKLHPDAQPDRLGLRDDERDVIDRIVDGLTVFAELAASCGVAGAVTRRVVYALLLTRCIDLSGRTRPPVGIGGDGAPA